ncbi:zinc-binding alcohol dehydrogenase family protein [Lactobacillus sp. CBA3606]|uniref:zinc-binding alcohol dehydrogenase family protein n=1 Tax=Lactobacillus sp. CBA3606 TaxID=2099789 RepID=UPI000CFC2C25|nr:zinc-binding alcohol dehydrogenase family protein [Lactobacillus sp. CBA3606]AVK63513.1 zinc-binding alcohol dehydrogenase family protein [Lactobacillus sp. CBA3606]
MKSFGFKEYLDINNKNSIYEFTAPIPIAKTHDILVKIKAVSVNPVDVYVRSTRGTPLKNPKVIGWDAYGTVASIGKAVTLFRPGDRVFYAGAFDRPGCDSEYHVVDERLVGKAPTSLNPAEIAAMPLTSLTAWESLFEQMAIDPSATASNHQKSLLIINGAGGVGSIAIQLAHMAGLHTIATASRTAAIKWVKALGADDIINHHQDLVQQVHELGYDGVDYILELNNLSKHWKEITKLINPSGVIVSTTGNNQPIKLIDLKAKRAKFAWEWMYSKSFFQTADMISQHEILNKISGLLDCNLLRTTLTQEIKGLSAKNLREAHKLVEKGHMIGKVVVSNK